MFRLRITVIPLLVLVLLVGCSPSSVNCPRFPMAHLPAAETSAADDTLPFQYPLEGFERYETAYSEFCTFKRYPGEYHAAEDYLRPAGTPVYAMAAGDVTFSGPMGGYGWLIIVDHPQANLYSLYGHLSPSRWHIDRETVEKGQLLGYLGDADENGGSAERPLRPHLHFGIRTGQRSGYPGIGEWRWQAGWIKPCPADLGWLQPSAIINDQTIPAGGFSGPRMPLLAVWRIELLFAGIYLIGGTSMLVSAIRKNRPSVLAVSCCLLLLAGWIFYGKGFKSSYAVFATAVLCIVIGGYHFLRRAAPFPATQS